MKKEIKKSRNQEMKEKIGMILNNHNIKSEDKLYIDILELFNKSKSSSNKKLAIIRLNNYEDIDIINNYLSSINLDENGEFSQVDINQSIIDLLISNDIQFEIISNLQEISFKDRFIYSYDLYSKLYQNIGKFNLSKKSSNGIHYEIKEFEIIWNEYGKRIKDLEIHQGRIKNSIIDEIIPISEGKIQIQEIEDEINQLKDDRLNKRNIIDFEIKEERKWINKEIMEDYLIHFGLSDNQEIEDNQEKIEDNQEKIEDNQEKIEDNQEKIEDNPKGKRKRKSSN